MPLVKSADVFIERSLNLLQVNPTTTRVSITYGSESKKNKNKDKVSKPTDENKSFVSFKTYDPVSGQLHKIKTNKIKELSKLLNALGPHGVSVPKVSKSSTRESDEQSTKKQKTVEQVSLRGFSSVWANSEIKEEEIAPEQTKQADTSNSGQQSGGKKNKKKKGKK